MSWNCFQNILKNKSRVDFLLNFKYNRLTWGLDNFCTLRNKKGRYLRNEIS